MSDLNSKIGQVQRSILNTFKLGISNGTLDNYQNTEKYKELVEKLCKIEDDYEKEIQIIAQMDEVPLDDFDKEYKQKVQLIENSDLKETEKYKDFANDIEDLLYQHGVKSVADLDKTTTVDGMEIDEVISTVDPITKGTIQNPVRNRHCGHIYDKNTICEAIKVSENKRVRCPTVGCSNKKSVETSDLVEDRELKRRFMAMLKT